jgi:hypothetical protein
MWFNGDFNYDGTVDTIDFNLLASNFGQVLAREAIEPFGAMVPEPSMGVLGAALGLSLTARRRRVRA